MEAKEILRLFKSDNEKDKEKAYKGFLGNTHYNFKGDEKYLKKFACKQLRLKSRDVFASEIKEINPLIVWASQDSVQEEKLEMVELAYEYAKKRNEEIPPVIVWHFYDSYLRYILHDGHHRVYFCHKHNLKVKAVILEPIGNYTKVENLFRNAFNIRKRAVNLPIKSLEDSEPVQDLGIDVDASEYFTKKQVKEFNVTQLKKMFEYKDDPMIPELAYLAFLTRSSWGINFNYKRGVERVRIDLNLPLYDGEGLDWKYRRLNPNKIWASEDSLDKDKYEMVKVAMKYMIKTNKIIPPVAVWKIYQPYNSLVCHDGHHRIYAAHELKIKIPAILMEYWIDNRENPLLEKKIHYNRINMYVKDMPIIKFTFD
ncbi:MAG: hypothetical protein GF364_03590 [Candidatus Lokiarchaeota archaeon]|nr:hypothetical protein [Candidatus Lokiarchaeota archaeon]